MKTPALRHARTARTAHSFGRIALGLLCLLAVFQLTQLSPAAANHESINLWRGLALGSLFFFLCLPPKHWPASKP